MNGHTEPSILKKWVVAARPWALPASTMPVLFGTSLAVAAGGARLDVLRFFLALAAMFILHLGANMLSDVFDYRRGLDKEVTPVSGAIVRGWLPAGTVAAGAAVLFAVGSLIGLVLVLMTGTVLLVIGLIGVVIGLCYSPLLKYHALGDLAVFLNFGILGSLGAWVVQTRSFSWLPVLWTIPMAMLVSAILHANNWRDTASDRQRMVTTMASLLGDRASLIYYGKLIYGPYAVILFFMLVPRWVGMPFRAMPLTFLVTALALPMARKLWKRALHRHKPERPMDFIILDGATAQYNTLFGLLCTAALWLQHVLRWP